MAFQRPKIILYLLGGERSFSELLELLGPELPPEKAVRLFCCRRDGSTYPNPVSDVDHQIRKGREWWVAGLLWHGVAKGVIHVREDNGEKWYSFREEDWDRLRNSNQSLGRLLKELGRLIKDDKVRLSLEWRSDNGSK